MTWQVQAFVLAPGTHCYLKALQYITILLQTFLYISSFSLSPSHEIFESCGLEHILLRRVVAGH